MALLNEMLEFTIAHVRLFSKMATLDQKLFDRSIRRPLPHGELPRQWPLYFEDLQLSNSSAVSWTRLPSELFTHNLGPRVHVTNETMTVHVSWGIESASDRIFCASTLGIIRKGTYTPPTKRRRCFEEVVGIG